MSEEKIYKIVWLDCVVEDDESPSTQFIRKALELLTQRTFEYKEEPK